MDGRIYQKIENLGIKIARVNSILITKSINMTVGVRCDVDIFKLTVREYSINWEIYDRAYFQVVYFAVFPVR